MSISELIKQMSPDWVSLLQSRLWQEQPAQIELENLLLDIWPMLQGLHQQSLIYGIWSPETVFLDRAGRAHLLPVTEERLRGLGAGNNYVAGYAAFEQHANDPAWPSGPWTDVYGVGMLLRSLILKQAPVSALKRMVRDELTPLSGQVNGFTRRFLRAIDCATVLEPNVRLRSIDELVVAMGLADISEIQTLQPMLVQNATAIQQPVPQSIPTPDSAAIQQLVPPPQMPVAQVHEQVQQDLPVLPETAQQSEPERPVQTVLPVKTASGSTENHEKQSVNTEDEVSPTDSLQLQQQYLASRKNAQRKPIWALMALVLAGAAAAVYFYMGDLSRTAANTGAEVAQTPPKEAPPPSLVAVQTDSEVSEPVQALQPERFVPEPVTGIPGLEAGNMADVADRTNEVDESSPDVIAPVNSELQAGQVAVEREEPLLFLAAQDEDGAVLAVSGAVADVQEVELNEPGPVVSEGQDMASINQQEQEQIRLQEQEAALALQASEEEAQRMHEMEQEQLRLSVIEQEKLEQKRLAQEKREEERRRKEQEQARMVTVSFSIQPWGEVSVNGRKRGASPPLRLLKLSPGTHVIDIRNGDLPVRTVTVDLQSGQETTISHKF